MSHTKTYLSKADFLTELALHTDKIDKEASINLPHFCLQDEEGKQYVAYKAVVMFALVNSICDARIIDLKRSCTYKRKFMSVSWYDSAVPRTATPVEEVAPVEEVVVATPKAPAKKPAPAKKAKKPATKKPAAKK